VKQTMGILLLALAVVAVAQTQKNDAGQASDATTQALIDAENHWVDALVKADVTALDAVFADTYVDTDEHSHRGNKEDVLSILKSGDLKLTSIKLSDMKVNVYGDAAVVIGSAMQAGSFLGGPIATKIIFTDTFAKQNGKWRAVASHRSVAE
jgi:ketosteroid isomerase-like protein